MLEFFSTILAKLHKIRRCALSTILALVSGLAIAGPSAAQDAASEDVMFVQSAPGYSYDPATRKMTLQDVSLVTVFFSSGTPPLAGNVLTSRFVDLWNTQIAANLAAPPIGEISLIDAGGMHQTVIALSSPTMEDGNLVYQVLPGDGEIELEGGDASLFINIAGVPASLFSFSEGSSGMFRRAMMK
jgi:hypothetical protein